MLKFFKKPIKVNKTSQQTSIWVVQYNLYEIKVKEVLGKVIQIDDVAKR
jgi:hypothetical protein